MTAGQAAVVAGIDGSAESDRALSWAAEEAVLRDASLYVVHCFEPLAGYQGAGLPLLHNAFLAFERAGRDLLDQAVHRAETVVAGRVPVTGDMPGHAPVPVFLELSRQARMIVLGATGRGGFLGMLAGSTAVAVSAHAHCPVVVVRGAIRPGGPVVVGVDGGGFSEAVGAAFDEAARRNVPLVAVHALHDHAVPPWPPAVPDEDDTRKEDTRKDDTRKDTGAGTGEDTVLGENLAGWREKYPGVRVDAITVADRPRHRLLDFSARGQLLVVAGRGRGGFAGMRIGSTSRALLHHARCPVLVVPAKTR